MVAIFEYRHSNHSAHRDLKPENLLLDDKMHIKLSDFGSAKSCPPSNLPKKIRRGTLVGTKDYVAPEVLLTQESDTAADLWSLGCVAYELFVGKPPFKSKQEEASFEKILWGDFVFPEYFPELAKDLCKRLITLERDKRLGMRDFENLKQHEFFSGIDFNNLKRDELIIGLAKNSVDKPIKTNSIDTDKGINYVAISPTKSYEVNYDYFSAESPTCNKNKTRDQPKKICKIIKEGILRKEGGLAMYQKVKLVLTNEPNLTYYDSDDVYMVSYLKL